MDDVHRILAYTVAAVVVLGTAWAAVLALLRRPGGRPFVRYQTVVIAVVVLAAVAGVVRFASNARPADNLHVMYGVVAVGIIPVARGFIAGREPRDSVLMLVAFVLLAGVVFRLFSTG